jgi:hypothetical protein
MTVLPTGGEKPVAVMACKVLQAPLAETLPSRLYRRIQFLDYGLHRAPARLNQTLQAAIDAVESPGTIVLGYGWCGNGIGGLRSGRHTLIVPRVDDCIALLLGSRRAYHHKMEQMPGTYFLTKGWLEAGSHPLSEYHEYAAQYGPEEAAWIMDQQYRNYQRLALIVHSRKDLEACRPQALEVADYCRRWDMRYEEIMGDDRYIRRLAAIIENPDAADAEFVIVPPGNMTCSGPVQDEPGSGFETV